MITAHVHLAAKVYKRKGPDKNCRSLGILFGTFGIIFGTFGIVFGTLSENTEMFLVQLSNNTTFSRKIKKPHVNVDRTALPSMPRQE